MRKLYSLVLLATALLIGTNAWANAIWDGLDGEKGANTISVKIGSTTKYTSSLQNAFDAVEAGQSAEITALEDLSLGSTVLLFAETLTSDPKDITLKVPENVTISTTNKAVFAILKNYLTIEGKGTISVVQLPTSWYQAAFVLYGSVTNTDADWTKLTIGDGIKVSAGIGIEVFDSYAFDSNKPGDNPFYTSFPEGYKTWWGANEIDNRPTNFFASTNPIQSGCAFGVKVLIEGTVYGKKYGVQVTGHVNQTAHQWDAENYPGTQFPTFTIASTASVTCAATQGEGGSSAIYGSGYAVWNIAGEVSGNSGLYLKAGNVTLDDATITATGTYAAPEGKNSGIGGAGGSAITIESNVSYSGNMAVEINGDTKVTSDDGYAIQEQVTTSDNTLVSSIKINGGTMNGGKEGAMIISNQTVDDPMADVVIYGGNINGTTSAGATGTLEDLLPKNSDTHITPVTDPETGKVTLVVSEGSAPATKDPDDPTVLTPWSWCADDEQSGKNVAWTEIEDAEITSGSVILGELQIISGSENNLQQLTINNGATLQVNHLIMNDYARIIVKAGGSLIIKGKQGIVAPKVENIVLKASESAQALFLFHPEVESNRHPNATVEFISNSITDNPFFSKQRFGIPTWKQLSAITTKNGGNDVQTAIASFSFEANDWIDVSWINIDGKDENLNLIANPFEYYQMQHNTSNAGTVVTMTGELYGNTNPTLSILGNSWNGYANSYMAPIDGDILIDLIPDEVDKSFQIYQLEDGAKGYWRPASKLDLSNINPMQAFLIGNTKEAANVTVDYWDAVYAPITGEVKPTPNAAPARRSALSNITKAKMVVRGEGYTDGVVLAQDDQFSAEFDNSYDCRKYMNEGINLYVSADEKMGIFATDNLENTYVGFQSVNGGTYTIEFTDVQGEGLTLIDHETGAQVLMVEGNTYEFTANGANDYRFEVVTTAKIATGIENTEAVKNAKGIYTITGQYVGEMNVWNSLPAGIYVIDGAKRVK